MKWSRLSFLAVGVALAALSLAAAPSQNGLEKVVAECYPPPDEMARLAQLARSKSRRIRHVARDEIITRLRVGMTRRQVEALLGPADDADREKPDKDGRLILMYYCRPAKQSPTEWWLLDYDTKQQPPRLVDKWPDHH